MIDSLVEVAQASEWPVEVAQARRAALEVWAAMALVAALARSLAEVSA